MSDDKIESMAKGRAIHRPQGGIKSYRKKILHLINGEMTTNEFIVYEILLHIVGWDDDKPNFGRIERNITRLHEEWFSFWKSRSTLIDALKSLAEKRYISDDREWISIPKFGTYQSKNTVATATPTVATATPTVATATITVATATPTVATATPDAPQTQSQSASDLSKEPLKKEELLKNPLTPERGEQKKRFDDFWKLYPKKKSKGDAEKAWNVIRPSAELFDEIISGLEKAKPSHDWTKEGGRFVPYPATWIRAKGWEDEIQDSPTPIDRKRQAQIDFFTPDPNIGTA